MRAPSGSSDPLTLPRWFRDEGNDDLVMTDAGFHAPRWIANQLESELRRQTLEPEASWDDHQALDPVVCALQLLELGRWIRGRLGRRRGAAWPAAEDLHF